MSPKQIIYSASDQAIYTRLRIADYECKLRKNVEFTYEFQVL